MRALCVHECIYVCTPVNTSVPAHTPAGKGDQWTVSTHVGFWKPALFLTFYKHTSNVINYSCLETVREQIRKLILFAVL
ncbi:hypothetical protein POVWA2_038670 [Plasmodium ovale wallikeri]|uniref:Uncharacterized protein n=1 Tax=Plasmodium ovale wallikeri TaxID=864142 RepID=A0A1A8Z6E9_PLAOA|nr:hypothetical protein POVWA1_039890 [Plasmodium ovale wallikeri]SBT39910.1 hypothetical protein POVWA2_038670 [Plasmodium ovale wallikeri]